MTDLEKCMKLVVMIWKVAFKYIGAHADNLLYYIFLQIVVLSFLGVASMYEPRLILLSVILHLFFFVMFAVAWHNYILAPKPSKTIWQSIKWDMHKWRYLGCFLLLIFAVSLAMNITVRPALWLLHMLNGFFVAFAEKPSIENMPPLIFGGIDLLALGGFLALCFPLSRLVYLFPLAAMGKKGVFKRSLQLSSASLLFSYIFFLSMGFFMLIFMFSGIVINYAMIHFFGTTYLSMILLSELTIHSFNYLTLAILVTASSFSYHIFGLK